MRIVEGFRLLPYLVKPLLSASDHAVWLLPSPPEFREATIQRRGGCTSGFLSKTSNPERALQNLLERDRIFTDRLRKEVEDLELRAIEVNAAMTEDDSAAWLRRYSGSDSPLLTSYGEASNGYFATHVFGSNCRRGRVDHSSSFG